VPAHARPARTPGGMQTAGPGRWWSALSMQAWYEARFDREMGCTAAEIQRWLPGASRGLAVQFEDAGAMVTLGGGTLHLVWRPLQARQIALMRMPRLAVSFVFEGVDAAERQAFMRYFDLYTQRGGG